MVRCTALVMYWGGVLPEMEEKAMRDKIIWIMLIGSIILLAIPYLMRVWEDDPVPEETAEVQEQEEPNYEEVQEIAKSEKTKDARQIPSDAIGEINIERLHIRYPVYEGTSEAELGRGIGHDPESAGLNQVGNCVLMGHNGSSRGSFFTFLNRAEKGDKVELTDKEGTTRIYSIVKLKIVDPYDRTVTKKTENTRLTLYTCAYHGSRRFVAICEPDFNINETVNVPSEWDEHQTVV